VKKSNAVASASPGVSGKASCAKSKGLLRSMTLDFAQEGA
jgi:hypothetical protein